MHFSETTKNCFKVMKDIFGGSVIRFLAGWRNEGHQGAPGHYDPKESQICFSLPSETTLNKHTLADQIFQPSNKLNLELIMIC